jgi:lambda repressor-like predicted transcriptional regulator
VPTQAAKAPESRSDTKLARVIAMLRRKEGTTIAQLAKATGWQEHSVRGAMSGAIKKKLGLTVTSLKSGDVRTYRIAN